MDTFSGISAKFQGSLTSQFEVLGPFEGVFLTFFAYFRTFQVKISGLLLNTLQAKHWAKTKGKHTQH